MSFAVRPRCTANPVNILLGHIGYFIVENMGDTFNINTTGSNIGRNENFDSAVPKSGQCTLALTLGFIAMYGHGGNAHFGKTFYHAVGTVFRAREHQSPVHFWV